MSAQTFCFHPSGASRVWGQPLRLNTMGQKVYQYDNDGTIIYIYGSYVSNLVFDFWDGLEQFVLATYWFSISTSCGEKNYCFRYKRFTGSPNRSQSLSQTRGNKTYPNKADLIRWFKHTNVPRKKQTLWQTPRRVEARHCWPSPATTCKGHNFVHSTMGFRQNLQLAGFCSGFSGLWFLFKLYIMSIQD